MGPSRSFHFYHTFDHIFTRKGIRKSSMSLCVTVSLTSAACGVAACAHTHSCTLIRSRGPVSGDLCLRQGRSAHGWLLSTAETPLSEATHEKAGAAAPPSVPPPLSSPSLRRVASEGQLAFSTPTSSCANRVASPIPLEVYTQHTRHGPLPGHRGGHSLSTESSTHLELCPFHRTLLVCACGHAWQRTAGIPLPRTLTPRPPLAPHPPSGHRPGFSPLSACS